MEPKVGLQARMLEVPAWRPPLHHDVPLGFPDVDEGRSVPVGVEETRSGYRVSPPFANESASVHQQIYERLARPKTMQLLNSLFDTVTSHRRNIDPKTIESWTAELPARVTLSPKKQALYFRALSDKNVPFAYPARYLPQSNNPEALLDLLVNGNGRNSVPVARACWLIQARGAWEIRENSCTHEQYTQMWTDTVVKWLDKQLDDLYCITSRLARDLKSTPPDPLVSTSKWESRWEYSMALVQAMRARDLLHSYTYLSWLTNTFSLAYGPVKLLVMQLMEEALPAIRQRASLAYRCMQTLSKDAYLASEPPCLVSVYANAFIRQMTSCPKTFPASACNACEFLSREKILSELIRLATRSERNSTVSVDAHAIHLLDTCTEEASHFFLAYFITNPAQIDVKQRIDLLLEWASSRKRNRPGRIPIAVRLLQEFQECQEGHLILSDGRRVRCPWTPISLFDTTMCWMDRVDAEYSTGFSAQNPSISLTQVARLVGALAREHLFSFTRYSQKLLARGIIRHHSEGQRIQRLSNRLHARIYRTMPIVHISDAIRSQRRNAIYGVRSSESYEETMERRALRELWTACCISTESPSSEDFTPKSSSNPSTRVSVSPAVQVDAESPSVPGDSPSLGRGNLIAVATDINNYRRDSIHLNLNSLNGIDHWNLPETPICNLTHLRNASPYVQDRVLETTLSAILDERRHVASAEQFRFLATVLLSLDAIKHLVELCLALLDRHVETQCVVSICRIVQVFAREFLMIGCRDAIIERLAPYAVNHARTHVQRRFIAPQGPTMAFAAAQAAIASLTSGPAESLPVACEPSAGSLQAAEPLVYEIISGSDLDHASEMFLNSIPFAETPYVVWHTALAIYSQADATIPSQNLLHWIGTLTGAAGAQLPIAAWIRDTYKLSATPSILADVSPCPAHSEAWCVLVINLLCQGYVNVDEVLEVLCWYMPHADPEHTFYSAWRFLSHAILGTVSNVDIVPAMRASVDAASFDMKLIRAQITWRNAWIPWLVAVSQLDTTSKMQSTSSTHTPSILDTLLDSFTPDHSWLSMQWQMYSEVLGAAAKTYDPSLVLKIVRRCDSVLVPENVSDSECVAKWLRQWTKWNQSFSLVILEWILETSTAEQRNSVVHSLASALSESSNLEVAACIQQLQRSRLSSDFSRQLAEAAMDMWLNGDKSMALVLAQLQQCIPWSSCEQALRQAQKYFHQASSSVSFSELQDALLKIDGRNCMPDASAAETGTPTSLQASIEKPSNESITCSHGETASKDAFSSPESIFCTRCDVAANCQIPQEPVAKLNLPGDVKSRHQEKIIAMPSLFEATREAHYVWYQLMIVLVSLPNFEQETDRNESDASLKSFQSGQDTATKLSETSQNASQNIRQDVRSQNTSQNTHQDVRLDFSQPSGAASLTGDRDKLLSGVLDALLQFLMRMHKETPKNGQTTDNGFLRLLEHCVIQVESAMHPTALKWWLASAPKVPNVLEHLVRYNDSTPSDPWSRLDYVREVEAPSSRDPLATALKNNAAIPLETFHTRKTRDSIQNRTGPMAPPSWLPTEFGYGDYDDLPAGDTVQTWKRQRYSKRNEKTTFSSM
ncbi:RNA polymerase II mediator complex subunit [Malassezia psittaci]|uniref:RNA polymerase II mediator complex subunit n=1 Tax=Malassezia psittaci TaxID=1821823 RepID=A0AAF0FEB3_9BASI|nr:RNA polymerase II mediator complex subunit [Malassezia psittaci]